ncbi:GNAT family N-acetyltransferase, partial [Paraburkholderia sp. BR10937]
MRLTISTTDSPDDGMLAAIGAPLARYNELSTGQPDDYRPLAVSVSHPETGEIVAGLLAGTNYGQLHVLVLFVQEELRG